ncbi:hypothetical protein H0264_14440 [Nocardia huaxiensis]|uniref:Fe2OG dioxygenase domain-containing protein n=1 Tax=Nocardia huaxiensis TaxID=2755382 RepID=A0A7D6ZDZ6_9NOCA|nr:hypothetical protein [Nocardia huaxiensis]QLY33268.1 hypothetical protein H0264_14440 [Nocardia huaxiensis]
MPAGFAETVVDLDRYPLDHRDAARLREVITLAQNEFAETGVAVFPDFLRPDALTEIAASLLVGSADEVPEERPFSAERVVAQDRIPDSWPLKQLYRWEPLLDFVSRVAGELVYRSADELGAVTVHIRPAGDGLHWQFGLSDYSVILQIVAPEQGGIFEYTPLPRGFLERGDGRRRSVRLLPTVPGTLVLHAGRLSRHRVTAVHGQIPRISVEMAFNAKPGHRLNDQQRRTYFGRTE